MDGQVHKDREHEAREMGIANPPSQRIAEAAARITHLRAKQIAHAESIKFHKQSLDIIEKQIEAVDEEMRALGAGQMEFEVGP